MKKSILIKFLTGVILVSSSFSVQSDELELAYQKEYAYLEAQQRNLMQRLQAFKNESAREKRALTGKLDALSRDLLVMKNESIRINELVFESERTLEETRNNRDLFESTFEQASASLKHNDVPVVLGDAQPADERMQVIYSKGLGLLDTLSAVNRTTGIFFDMEGKKVSGDVYRIGQIAAVGVSDASKGLLVPAGPATRS